MSGAAVGTKPAEQATDPYLEFDALMGELDAFSKALTAAPEPAPAQAPAPVATKPAAPPQPSMLEKALQAGNGVELDGEEVMKALSADLSATVRSAVADVSGTVGAANEKLLKGLSMTLKALTAQGQIIKAQDLKINTLTEEMVSLGGQPRMRKSVLNIHDRGGNPAGVEPKAKPGQHPDDSCSRDEFMEKAVNANIGGAMVSVCRQHLNLFPDRPIQEAIPPHIYKAVMKDSK